MNRLTNSSILKICFRNQSSVQVFYAITIIKYSNKKKQFQQPRTYIICLNTRLFVVLSCPPFAFDIIYHLTGCGYGLVGGISGPPSNGGGGHGGGGGMPASNVNKQHTRARRTQRRVTHNEKRYHSGIRSFLTVLTAFKYH